MKIQFGARPRSYRWLVGFSAAFFCLTSSNFALAQGEAPARTVSFCQDGKPFLATNADGDYVVKKEITRDFSVFGRGALPLPSEWRPGNTTIAPTDENARDVFAFIKAGEEKQNAQISENGYLTPDSLTPGQKNLLSAAGVLSGMTPDVAETLVSKANVQFKFDYEPLVFVNGLSYSPDLNPESEVYKKEAAQFEKVPFDKVVAEVLARLGESVQGDFQVKKSDCYPVCDILPAIMAEAPNKDDLIVSDLLKNDSIYLSEGSYLKKELVAAILFALDINIHTVGKTIHFSPNNFVRDKRLLAASDAYETNQRWGLLSPFVTALKNGKVRSRVWVKQDLILSPRLVAYPSLTTDQKKYVAQYSRIPNATLDAIKGKVEVFFAPVLTLFVVDPENRSIQIGYGTGIPGSYAWIRSRDK